jgi:hypothetical protein
MRHAATPFSRSVQPIRSADPPFSQSRPGSLKRRALPSATHRGGVGSYPVSFFPSFSLSCSAALQCKAVPATRLLAHTAGPDVGWAATALALSSSARHKVSHTTGITRYPTRQLSIPVRTCLGGAAPDWAGYRRMHVKGNSGKRNAPELPDLVGRRSGVHDAAPRARLLTRHQPKRGVSRAVQLRGKRKKERKKACVKGALASKSHRCRGPCSCEGRGVVRYGVM